MSGPATTLSDDSATEFARAYAEKAIEQAQADAHAAINAVFGQMRDALNRRKEKPPREVEVGK